MKKNLSAFVCIMLIFSVCASLLTGCGSAVDALNRAISQQFSAKDLVQNNLDLIYLNKYTEEYLDDVRLTSEMADQQYADGIASEARYFAYYFDIDLELCGDEITEEIESLYRNIYSHSRYEVGEDVVSGENHLVSLTVYPIDIVRQVIDLDMDSANASWSSRIENGEFDEMTEQEFEIEWARMIIDLFAARLDHIDYFEPETISVQVVKDADGYFVISDNDFQRIDDLMIAY